MRLPRRLCQTIACGSVWASFGCSAAGFFLLQGPVKTELFRWISAFDFHAPAALRFDSLSAIICLMVTFVAGMIHLYSIAYMREDKDYLRFFTLLNLFLFAMLLLLLADTLPLLFLGWEGVGFCSYALIGFWYREEANATAGRKAFIVTRIGDVAFGVAIFWMFTLFGTVSISEINQMGHLIPVSTVTLLGLLLLGGAIGKSAQMPLMVWLPDAMAGPTPVSALIHAATMVIAGIYLLCRFFPFIGISPLVPAVIASIGAATALYAASSALAQRDLKRILAYSTMSQIGLMMLGVGSGAITAATFHLLVHAFFKALLFMGAGCIIMATGHEQDIFKMGGLRRKLPRTFWPFLVGAASLAGLPLTGGFFSKDAILVAVYAKGGLLYPILFVLAECTALLTAIYTFRMVYLVFGGEERDVQTVVPRSMEITLIPLAVTALFGGLLNLPEYFSWPGWLGNYLSPFMGIPEIRQGAGLEIILQIIAAFIALAGLVIAHTRYSGGRWQARQQSLLERKITAFFLEGWYFDRLYRYLFVRPYNAVSTFLWTGVDEGIFGKFVDSLGNICGVAGESLGRWSNGRISIYLASFIGGAVLLLVYFAWEIIS
jgi:NADH-quinone oxidoreductase subunit L